MLSQKIKAKSTIIYIFFLTLSSITLTIVALGIKKTFAGEDYGFGYNFPRIPFNLARFMWDSYTAPGKVNVSSALTLIWSTLILWLFYIINNPIIVERVIYALFFSVGGIGIFFLIRILIKQNLRSIQIQQVNAAAVVSGLLYIFNHYLLFIASYPLMSYHLTFMLLPWAFYLFISNFQVRSNFIKTVCFSLLILIISGGNPSNTLTICILILSYLLFFIKEIYVSNKNFYKFLITSLVLILLFVAFIYIPMFALGSNPYGDFSANSSLLTSLNVNSKYSSFLNLFRLSGSYAMQTDPNYLSLMQNPLLIIAGFFLPISIMFSLIINSFKKLKLFFAIVLVISLFLAKGSHPPFGSITQYLITHNVIFGMYRAVYHKFTFYILFSYTILFGLFIYDLLTSFNKTYRKIKYVIFFSLIIAVITYCLPFLNRKNITSKILLTNYPTDYSIINGYLKKDKNDFKILALPPAPSGAGLLLKWGNNYYSGPHSDKYFFNKPILDSYWFFNQYKNRLTNEDSWTGASFENNFLSLTNSLRILNIKYILLHKDFPSVFDFGIGVEKLPIDNKLKVKIIQQQLRKMPFISLIKDTKYLSLYKINEEYYLPHIYIANKIVCLQDPTISHINQASASPNFNIVYVSLNDCHLHALQTHNTNTPTSYTVNKVNPTQYRISIKNDLTKPFLLVFDETYDKNWKLSTKQNIYINNYLHLQVNGYANAWYINPKDMGSTKLTTLIINYDIQNDYNIGLFISGIAVASCLFFIISKIAYKFYSSHIVKK